MDFSKLKPLYEATEIPHSKVELIEGQCVIDSIVINFTIGEIKGYQISIEATGYKYKSGTIQKYEYSSKEKGIKEFSEDVKNIPFYEKGELIIIDEHTPMVIETLISASSECAAIYKDLEDINHFCNKNEEDQYYLMRELYLEPEVVCGNVMGGI